MNVNPGEATTRHREETRASNWRRLFEERHGVGAYEQLIADLAQPCVTFAAIAERLGVTRERVRQWQLKLLPDAPRGRRRRGLCAEAQQKQRLLVDPLFQVFHGHARAQLSSARIDVVTTRSRYQRLSACIDHYVVALRSARPHQSPAGPVTVEYRLAAYRGGADFVYYLLADDEYLLLPAHHLRDGEARFVNAPGARYGAFKNTFAAVHADSRVSADADGDAGETVAI